MLQLEGRTCMSQAESPEPQVGRGVGDAAQAVLDGVNGLIHCHIRKVKLWAKVTGSG